MCVHTDNDKTQMKSSFGSDYELVVFLFVNDCWGNRTKTCWSLVQAHQSTLLVEWVFVPCVVFNNLTNLWRFGPMFQSVNGCKTSGDEPRLHCWCCEIQGHHFCSMTYSLVYLRWLSWFLPFPSYYLWSDLWGDDWSRKWKLNIPFSGNNPQLLLRDAKVFWDQRRYMTPPICSRSAPGLLPVEQPFTFSVTCLCVTEVTVWDKKNPDIPHTCPKQNTLQLHLGDPNCSQAWKNK